MIPDKELQKTFKVLVDEKGTLRLIFLEHVSEPDSNSRVAELIAKEILKVFGANPKKKYNVFIDLSLLGKRGYVSSRARKTYVQLAQHKQANKVAIAGGSIFLKTITGFILHAAGKGEKMKWFANKKEAIKWLLK